MPTQELAWDRKCVPGGTGNPRGAVSTSAKFYFCFLSTFVHFRPILFPFPPYLFYSANLWQSMVFDPETTSLKNVRKRLQITCSNILLKTLLVIDRNVTSHWAAFNALYCFAISYQVFEGKNCWFYSFAERLFQLYLSFIFSLVI